MKGHKKVIEYLNKGLRSELTAVSQYWVHFRLLEDWGFSKLAKKEREELIEEMHHADKFIARIVFLEGHPNLQTLDPLMIGQNIKEVLECDLKAEYGARDLYREAYKACSEMGDFVSMELFKELLEDEEGHIDFIESELSLLEKIGLENYGQLQADPSNKKDNPSSELSSERAGIGGGGATRPHDRRSSACSGEYSQSGSMLTRRCRHRQRRVAALPRPLILSLPRRPQAKALSQRGLWPQHELCTR